MKKVVCSEFGKETVLGFLEEQSRMFTEVLLGSGKPLNVSRNRMYSTYFTLQNTQNVGKFSKHLRPLGLKILQLTSFIWRPVISINLNLVMLTYDTIHVEYCVPCDVNTHLPSRT